MLDRPLLERSLIREAAARGIEFRLGSHVLSFDEEGLEVAGLGRLRARIYIGADGPRSIVGRGVSAVNRSFLRAVQYTFPLAEARDATDVYFSPSVPCGYCWFFPKARTVNVGVGVPASCRSPRALLEAFAASLPGCEGAPLFASGGFIPCGGPLDRIAGANWMLVGDAAGYADPVTGGGIPQAFLMGAQAGRAAAAHLGGERGALRGYGEFCGDHFGGALRRAAQRRREMERDWKSDDFSGMIQRNWPGFKEYYRA